MHCQHGLSRQASNGHTLSSHAVLTPVVVCPGHSQVIALPPESIMPQDGHATQDCERAAGTRWLAKHATQVAPHGVPLLGDDLYSNQPFCALALQNGYNFIFVCKPDSPPTLSERLAFWQTNDGIAELESRHWNGRYAEVIPYRYIKNVLLRGGDDALSVQWCERTVVNAKTGEPLYHNSLITNHRVTAAIVAAVAHAGRGRWKSANENNHVLKTKGSHIEHNVGHGKKYLSALLLSLNLLALLFHTVLAWRDNT